VSLKQLRMIPWPPSRVPHAPSLRAGTWPASDGTVIPSKVGGAFSSPCRFCKVRPRREESLFTLGSPERPTRPLRAWERGAGLFLPPAPFFNDLRTPQAISLHFRLFIFNYLQTAFLQALSLVAHTNCRGWGGILPKLHRALGPFAPCAIIRPANTIFLQEQP
jgi:hypothetical protein